MTRTRFFLLTAAASLVVALLAIWLVNAIFWAPSAPESVATRRSRADIEAAAGRHIAAAELEARAVIDRRSRDFIDFIEQRKAGVKPFSAAIYSWRGKWAAIKARIPYADHQGHQRYVEERFSEHIFSAQQLEDATVQVVRRYQLDLAEVENRLSVALRKEILGRPITRTEKTVAMDLFQKAVQEMVAASQRDVTKTVANLVTAEVAAQVTAQTLRAAAVSMGALSSGAAISAWTAGAGILIGFVATELWEWIDKPEEKIETATISALDGLAESGAAAIRTELNRIAQVRENSWRETSKKAIEEMEP